ncbi:hypothetical protein GCM10010919_32980 [Alishewanella longhuensis]|uniref:DUF1579 domain-containing protein n=1 Tax=Alishewanella longhuensis TaxID=1091037 RepID=A0ABQ3L4N6_9ALTE|nr:hypothetical protein [Alishewanella longhuensis]GHG77385.1 hypothetical protein GCM10010919_32980 [Alishewanella longhuensis]
MFNTLSKVISTLVLLSLCALAQASTPSLHPKLEVFRPYLDTYWQGDLTQPGKTDKTLDRSHWSRALNGMAIKTVHSINDGVYGGESMIFWDEAKQSLAYYYFTTAGFYTHGTMEFDSENKLIIAREKVENNANGITEVQSSSELSGEVLKVRSRYLQNGQWVEGHSANYQRVGAMPIKFN